MVLTELAEVAQQEAQLTEYSFKLPHANLQDTHIHKAFFELSSRTITGISISKATCLDTTDNGTY